MRHRFSSLFARAALIALAVAPPLLHAQQVFWDPDRGSLGVGKALDLTLVFDNCTPDGAVSLPDVDGLEFGQPSMTSQTNMMNFRVQRRYLVSYPVTATREGEIVIPAFSVATSEGRYTVPEARFEAGTAGVGPGGPALTDIIKSELRLSRSTVWIGEVVDAEYVIASSPRYSTTLVSEPRWTPDGLVREPFGEGERVSITVDGETWPGLRFRTRFMAAKTGTLTLDPVELRINVQTGPRTGFFGFSQPQVERFSVTSDPRELGVRPLPEPAPDDFAGAIGVFAFESRVVPETARIGDPITWTLTLRGAGNWPATLALPEREVSADFQVVQPDVQQIMDDGRLFNGSLTEDAVLIPTRAGTYSLGPVEFSFFNTTTGKYESTSVPPVEVVIQPPSGTDNRAPPPPQYATPDENVAPSTETPWPRRVTSPTPLPQDPIPTGDSAVIPLGVSRAWWFAVALLPPALAWLTLAWRQLSYADKSRERRAARRTAQNLIAGLMRTRRTPNAHDLMQWRRAAARLWRISRATPTREDLARAITGIGRDAEVDAWVSLWQETDVYLFGPTGALPADWVQRADQALQQVRIGRQSPRLPLRRHYWFPRFAMVTASAMLVGMLFEARGAADQAIEAYRAGEFATARELWMNELGTHPHDWAVHNNLGLAWAQEEQWAQASAHWTAAFLLDPRDETVRANLRLALTRLGGIDPAVRRILAGSLTDRAATWLSPGEWDYVFFGGAIAFASGWLAVIVGMYRSGRVGGWRPFGFALILLGIVSALAAMGAHGRYGPLAQRTAGLVTIPVELRSIPTDLAEKQQTAPVAPGTVVVVTDTFLDWDRVLVGTTVSGWLRREAAVPFYRSLPRPRPQESGE